MKAAALFAGQGFQKFGILNGLAKRYPVIVDPLLAEVDEALPSLELSRLLAGSGPEVDVTPTELAQPLMLACGIVSFRVWNEAIKPKGTTVAFGLGHSLGEYTALTASGLLPFKAALQLARARGEIMRDAGALDTREQGMMLVNKPRAFAAEKWLPLFTDTAKKVGADVALYNSPSLMAASGTFPELNTFVDVIREVTGEKRLITKRLPVSSAFHSRFMKPATPKLAEIIANAPWQPFAESLFPVVSNVTARPYTSIEEVKSGCIEGLTAPVQWSQSVQFVDEQADEFVSMGANIGSLMKSFVKAESTVLDAAS